LFPLGWEGAESDEGIEDFRAVEGVHPEAGQVEQRQLEQASVFAQDQVSGLLHE
jgi:hypothetical protein